MGCDKKSYTKKEANEVINSFKKGRKGEKRPKRIPKRIYHCDECNMWHVTSKDRKDDKRFKKGKLFLKGGS